MADWLDIEADGDNHVITIRDEPGIYLVDRSRYEDVTGADVPYLSTLARKVPVGGLGHPLIDLDVPQDQAFLFSSMQTGMRADHPDSYADDLLDRLADHDTVDTFIDDLGPVTFDISHSHDDGEFKASLQVADVQERDIEEVYRAVEDVNDLAAADIQDTAGLQATVDGLAADTVDPRTVPTADALQATQEASRFERDGTTGYLFNPEEPLLVSFGDELIPFGDPANWVEEDIDTVVKEFADGRYDGLLWLDDEKLKETIDRQSQDFFETFVQRNYVDDGDHPHYETLQNFESLEEELPRPLVALRELAEDYDFSIEQPDDRIKLKYFVGGGGQTVETDLMQQFADDLETAVDTEQSINVRRLQGLEDCIGDMERVYQDWKGEYRSYDSAEEAVEGLTYNKEAVERFCKEQQDRLEGNDGLFVSALINRLGIEEIELPDMEGVDYLGAENDGTEIVVDGDAGTKLGHRMQAGRIEVKGSIRYYRSCPSEDCDKDYHVRTGSAGKEMEGGEIYIHGNVDSLYSDGNDIFTKEEHWLRDDTWNRV